MHRPAASNRTKRFLRWLLGAAILTGILWMARAPILRTAGRLWIVEESPIPSCAIVVLGGGENYRPFAAARLWKQGLAPVILVPNIKFSPTESLGLRPNTTKVILGVLKSEGVPDRAIHCIGSNISSTRDEAFAVKAWLETPIQQSASQESNPSPAPGAILIPTDPFAARRTNAFFEKTLPAYDVRVIRADRQDLDVNIWWTQEEGLISFQNEVIKWLFYKIKY